MLCAQGPGSPLLVTGVVVWGLIFYAIWRYRRRSDDDVPVQTRYNLPLEIFYTIAPIVMVVVFFVHTERDPEPRPRAVPHPDLTVYVVGQQWTWTFNYLPGGTVPTPGGKVLYSVGEAGTPPTLVLPVDKTVTFKLHSPDVIHDFGVPGFLMKMDVIPGPAAEDNQFSVTPTVLGTYRGKCYELCGVYHSRMLFDVRIVSEADYEAYLLSLQTQGNVSDQPLLGGIDLTDPVGPRTPARDAQRRLAMTATTPTTTVVGEPRRPLGEKIVKVLTTTDHKVIGKLYLGTSFAWFLVGGVMALHHALRAGQPGHAVRQRRALQPAVHDARHDHAAAVRDAAVLRLRQRRSCRCRSARPTSRSRGSTCSATGCSSSAA